MSDWTLRLRQFGEQRKNSSAQLLPLPRETRYKLSRQCHLHLEALLAGKGSLLSLQLLMRAALATALLEQLGYGRVEGLTAEELEAAAQKSLDSGDGGEYGLDVASFRKFAQLLTCHDGQLE